MTHWRIAFAGSLHEGPSIRLNYAITFQTQHLIYMALRAIQINYTLAFLLFILYHAAFTTIIMHLM